MSAYIVDDATINRALGYLRTSARVDGHFYPVECVEGYDLKGGAKATEWRRLGRDMMDLNVAAVDARYGEGEGNAWEVSQQRGLAVAAPYKYVNELCGSVQAYKALRIWLYQCSEGNVPESDLFKMMELVSFRLACDIVNHLDEYHTFPWE